MSSIEPADVELVTPDGSVAYTARPGERLLYAGLRAGVPLPYECASGTCGECRARLLEGEVRDLWPQAPAGRQLRRARNEILLCQSAACGHARLQVRRLPGTGGRGIRPIALAGILSRVRRLTPEVMEIVVEPERPMRFAAGQFVLVQVPGVAGYRAYSMVNDDDPAPTLTFLVRRKPGGGVSEWLFGGDRRGSRLDLFGPLGKAVFDPRAAGDVVCIAGGSGIAGMMAIARRAVAGNGGPQRSVEVFFGVRNDAELFYAEELGALSGRAAGRLSVTVAFSEGAPRRGLESVHPGLAFDAGLVHEVALRRMRSDPSTATAFLAGPPPAVDAGIRGLVAAAKFPLERIRFDRFG